METGTRKVRAFYFTSIAITLITVAFVLTSMMDGYYDHALDVVKMYLLLQPSLTGAFFGFNFGEHWAKKGQ